MANVGRKPDYTLSAKTKTGGFKGRIGAAWKQDDGSIQLKLDPFVQLSGAAIAVDDIWLTLYPTDENYKWEAPKKEEKTEKHPNAPDFEDDVPF